MHAHWMPTLINTMIYETTLALDAETIVLHKETSRGAFTVAHYENYSIQKQNKQQRSVCF